MRTLREGSPKTIKYNSGLRVTYFAMADDAFRQVRAADSERNIVSRIIGGWKKSDDVIRIVRFAISHLCVLRFSRRCGGRA